MPKKVVEKKEVKKVDNLGMAPAVHRNKIDKDIEILNKRIDDLIDDFTEAIKKVQDKLDKVSGRMGLPKSWS
tara:strand:+ start:519 stop:734 length:216 start_codon:yes stop_codon:yes gene_type:complete